MHGLDWRRAASLVPSPSQRRSGKINYDHRRAGKRRPPASCAAGFSRCGRFPVRFLHTRNDHKQRRAPARKTQSHILGNYSILAREYLPLRDASAHNRRGSSSRKNDARGSAMNGPAQKFVPEPERYEFRATPIHHFELDRRDFFKLLGAGIAVFAIAKNSSAMQETAPGPRSFHGEELPKEITSWLHVGEDGSVTGFTGKVEIGQNIRTSLAQTIADELRVPFESVRMVTADTALTPFDAGTFGSRTTPTMTPQFRRVAAAARDLLIRVAAEEWKIAGKPVPKVDGRAFVTGRHQYTPDLRPAGMLYGKVLRPPSFGATLTAYDDSAAKAITGVTIVRDGDFVAAAALTEHDARTALAAIRTQWKEAPAKTSSREIFSYLKNTADAKADDRHHTQKGSVENALAGAAHRLDATYNVAYIAHAPLEPRAALAEWSGDKLTVWTGSQRPFRVRGELADSLHIPETNVRVIVPDTGSAYGGKHTGDAAIEAARLARAARRPVEVVWTREEEFTWAYFRPAGVIEVKSAISP